MPRLRTLATMAATNVRTNKRIMVAKGENGFDMVNEFGFLFSIFAKNFSNGKDRKY
jgi:hypothetical protein